MITLLVMLIAHPKTAIYNLFKIYSKNFTTSLQYGISKIIFTEFIKILLQAPFIKLILSG